MTESIWKILKLDWKALGIFFIQKSGNPVIDVAPMNQVTSHCSLDEAVGCHPMNPHLIWLSFMSQWRLVEEYSENYLLYAWECPDF